MTFCCVQIKLEDNQFFSNRQNLMIRERGKKFDDINLVATGRMNRSQKSSKSQNGSVRNPESCNSRPKSLKLMGCAIKNGTLSLFLQK